MWQTMQHANGCGLAAPQLGILLDLFVVDSHTTYKHMDAIDRTSLFEASDTGIRETFINAHIIEQSPQVWTDDEGCLSIPGLSAPIERPWHITVEYYDASFQKHTKQFSGLTARMIQHEKDHTLGRLYLDYLSPLERKLIHRKLEHIQRGQVKAKYPMRFN